MFRELPVGEHIRFREGGMPREGVEAPSFFALCISSIWLFLSCLLYNKLVTVSRVFSWALWAILANYRVRGGVSGTLRFLAHWSEVQEGLGPATCRVSLVGLSPITCGIRCWLRVGSVRIELNCRTLSWCQRIGWYLLGKKKTYIWCQKCSMGRTDDGVCSVSFYNCVSTDCIPLAGLSAF